MSKELTPQENNESDIIFYTTDGAVHIEVFFKTKPFDSPRKGWPNFLV